MNIRQNRNFVRLWLAKVGSAFGSRITRTVMPIIAIMSLGATTSQIGLLAVLSVSPGVVVAIFMGGVIDRGQKKRILIVADVIRAVTIMLIPLLAWFGLLTITHLYFVAFITGIASAIFGIADNTFLPAIVSKDQLVDANSKLEATDSIAEAAGPGIAGVLVDLITAPFAMVIDAATYLWSAIMLTRINIVEEHAEPKPDNSGMLSDAIRGLKLCLSIPAIRSLLAIDAIATFFGGFFMALYMVLGLTLLNLSPATLGIVISVGGVGAFVGAISANRISARLGTRRALFWMLAAGQTSVLLIPLSLAFPEYGVWFLAATQFLEDAFLTVFIILAMSLRQQVVPADMLGRVNATFYVMGGALLPVSALLAGPLVILIGFEETVWIAAIGGLLAIAAFRIPHGKLID